MNSKSSGKKRGVRLKKPQDARRLMSRLITQAVNGDISVDLLRGVSYAVQTLLRTMEAGDFEERLNKLEQAQQAERGNPCRRR